MSKVRKLGNILAVAGVMALGYGALAFWAIPALPPNGGMSGRLPSLYVMGAGIEFVLLGLAARDLRLQASAAGHSRTETRTGVPTWLGVLLLLALVVACFVAVSYM